MDLYMNESGDLSLSSNGDLAVTDTPWRDDAQQAYIRMMTDPGDFTMYPDLGAGLSRLYGQPQSPETGALGERLIEAALDREGRFRGKPFTVKAVPIGYQAIRFDVAITSGSRELIRLSVEQNLSIQ